MQLIVYMQYKRVLFNRVSLIFLVKFKYLKKWNKTKSYLVGALLNLFSSYILKTKYDNFTVIFVMFLLFSEGGLLKLTL